jgi:very-short-patch-repair endonuclease
MDASIARVSALAADQQGLVTRAQLLAFGRSKRQIDHAVAEQALIRVHPGVYRISGSPLTADSALAAGLLLTGGVASHRSAAHLLELLDAGPTSPEVTVAPIQCQQKSGLIVHRSSDLLPSDIIRMRSLRCTNATRTLIDLGAVVSDSILESALERALHRRLTTVSRVRGRLVAVSRRGRPGVASLRRVLDMRTPRLAASESELELLLWRILRRHRIPLPERQVEVRIDSHTYRLDYAYRSEQIFIEGDGFGVHSTRAAFESDRLRQNRLAIAGWLPLRFTWQQARQSEKEVAGQVRGALSTRRQSELCSPQAGQVSGNT